jgi:hypothetical protein
MCRMHVIDRAWQGTKLLIPASSSCSPSFSIKETKQEETIQKMPRKIKVAAIQIGAVHKWSRREETLARIIKLVEQAAEQGATLAVLPEVAFTTFFPRYPGLDEDPVALDEWFEEGEITTSKNVKVGLRVFPCTFRF